MSRTPARPALPATLKRLVVPLLTAALLIAGVSVLAAPAEASRAPIEDYASYQPQRHCSPKAKPGTTYLGHWLVRRYGGGFGPISRRCGSGGTSEHKAGRAFDWSMNASRKADRVTVRAFLERAFRENRRGDTDVLARRMGIMYVIWNDKMYSAWNRFEPQRYLSSSCKSRKKCSKTLRHRNHVHISLSRPGGRGDTSWYAGRVS